jgi:single-strand DNA-binding protein
MSDTTVVGNIGEPQLKFTPSGKPVLEFSLAENHSKKNAQGGWDDDGTTWRRVSIWEKKAENLAEVLKKGDRVIVTGNERIREWESKDGGKGQSLELNARDIGIIPRASQNGGGQRTQQDTWGAQQGGQQQADTWGNGAGATSEPPF